MEREGEGRGGEGRGGEGRGGEGRGGEGRGGEGRGGGLKERGAYSKIVAFEGGGGELLRYLINDRAYIGYVSDFDAQRIVRRKMRRARRFSSVLLLI